MRRSRRRLRLSYNVAATMDDTSLCLLLGSIAEQQYRFQLLVRLMVEKKIVTSEELDSRFSEDEKFQFSHDLLEYLVSNGLQMSENLLSALAKAPLSVGPRAATEATDPESGKK